uniref:DUF659 domain-containing protein n=1 Tax=Clastoptera arizonana TaxID=38151 RepID=A0A1B6D3E1_9HEMI
MSDVLKYRCIKYYTGYLLRVITDSFKITEELLSLHPMKGTTQSTDLFQSINEVLDKFSLRLNIMVIDDCPSMVGKNKGIVALAGEKQLCHAFPLHHTPTTFVFKNVMNIVYKVVNLIRFQGLKHQQFQNLLAEIYSEYEEYICNVRWLYRGKMLVFDFKEAIKEFTETKQKPVDEFINPTCLRDLAFCADINHVAF